MANFGDGADWGLFLAIQLTCDLASHADVLRLVTRSSPRTWGGTRDKPKNVSVGGYLRSGDPFLYWLDGKESSQYKEGSPDRRLPYNEITYSYDPFMETIEVY